MKTKNDNPVLLVGAGGHAKVLLEVLKIMGREIVGLVTKDLVKGDSFYGIDVLGDDDVLIGFSPCDVDLVNGIGALPGVLLRWDLAKLFRERGFEFASVIHPAAVIANDIVLHKGVQIMAGCVIQPNVTIGQDTIVNTGTTIDHDCYIGDNCHLAPGVTLCGSVNIGDNSIIGAGATVIQDIKIGESVIAAAGSVIYENISNGDRLIQRVVNKDHVQ